MPASLLRRALVVFCLVILGLVPLARGQEDDGPVMQAGPFALPFSGRSLAAVTRIVGLDREQQVAARELHQGYRAAYSAATKKVRQRQEELSKKAQESGDWQTYSRDAGKATVDFIEASRKLEKGLLEDIKALCTPAQVSLFDGAERARRREMGLLVSLGVGERVDLVAMLEGLKIERGSTPALSELVAHWESDIDRLLTEKDQVIRDGMKETMGAQQGPESIEKMQKFLEKLTMLCTRIGETNRRAATEAQGLIPEAKREAFTDEVRERSFPRIYGSSPVTRSIKAALAMKDLSADQKSRLGGLQDTYRQEVAPINARWASAAEEKQRQLAKHFLEMMQTRGGQDPADPFYAARKERQTLDEKYQARIAEVLTAEQKDQLPKPPHSNSDIPEFLPDFETDFMGEWNQWRDEGK